MKRSLVVFAMACAFALGSLSAEEVALLNNSQQQPGKTGFELGLSHMLRPSVSWLRHYGSRASWYYGARLSSLVVPFPIDKSQSDKETCITYFTFYPEASLVLGGSLSPFTFLDFKIDLNIGGDAFFQYSSLKIPEYDINRTHLAKAATPWSWLRPAIRFNPGPLCKKDWLNRLSAEVSAIVALGSPLFIDERLRLELSLFWHL